MEFEWDENKSQNNYKKHGIRFEEAQTVFLDSKAIEFFDENHSESEDRYIRLGYSRHNNILLIVFCERVVNIIRIISARKATTLERRLYEKRV